MNGVTIPTLPSNYGLGTPILTPDVRPTKEFAHQECYRFAVFGEVFNLFNIANLSGDNFELNTVQAGRTFAFGQPIAPRRQMFGAVDARAIQVGSRFLF
jgi:hypothetical protein